MALRYPLVMRYCTCSNVYGVQTEAGKHQRQYETYRAQNMSVSESLNRMGLSRICCRDCFMNPAHLYLQDANSIRFRDEVGHTTQTGTVTYHGGEDILPSTPPPPFPHGADWTYF